MRTREIQAAIRRKHKLPKRCECGGDMSYDVSFGRVWSVCLTCSPVHRIDLAKLRARSPATGPAAGGGA